MTLAVAGGLGRYYDGHQLLLAQSLDLWPVNIIGTYTGAVGKVSGLGAFHAAL